MPNKAIALTSAKMPIDGQDDLSLDPNELEVPALPQRADSTLMPESPEPFSREQIPVPLIPGGLTLVDAIETSLAQNPDLVALRRNEGVGRGLLGVARTYPFNPFVQVQVTPFQDAKVGPAGGTYHYVLLMQQIQLAHQQRYREDNALAALSSIRWNIAQAELLNLAQTERLYFAALYQRGIRELTRASADLNQQLLHVLEKQLEIGQAAAADVAIVRLDSQATRTQAGLAEANYQTALLDLRRQLNVPLEAPLDLAGDLTAWQWRFPLSSAADSPQGKAPTNDASAVFSLAAGRPDVLAARADLVAARASARLARASRHPDLQIGPYYQRSDSGTTFYGLRAQTDIPIMNNGMPLVRQREAELRQRQGVWQQLETRARLEAMAAHDRYRRAQELLSLAGDESASLPDELARLEEQFRAGEVDILRVFQARTSLIQSRRARLDAANEVAQAAAALTAATGLPPDAFGIGN